MNDDSRIFALLQDLASKLGAAVEGIQHLKETAASSKEEVAGLTERVRQNEHARRNEAQVVGMRIDRIESSNSRIETNVANLGTRIDHLETPVRAALERKQKRRRLWIRVTAYAAGVGTVMWAVLDPIWKVTAEYLARKWMGEH